MTRFVVTARAGIDVREILERLTMFPASGARRSSLGPFARIAVLDPYVVVYDHVGEEVRIIRVLDGRRNITRRLVRR